MKIVYKVDSILYKLEKVEFIAKKGKAALLKENGVTLSALMGDNKIFKDYRYHYFYHKDEAHEYLLNKIDKKLKELKEEFTKLKNIRTYFS